MNWEVVSYCIVVPEPRIGMVVEGLVYLSGSE